MIRRILIIGMLSVLCLPLACTDLGTEPPVNGIDWNLSIDAVRLGDDSSTVIRKLGSANYMGIGDFAGYILYYTSGPHAGLEVVIYTRVESSCGLGVRFITVRAPYPGTTKDGIGLGSTQEQLKGIFGPPTHSSDSGDEYAEGSSRMIVQYETGKVSSMQLACF